MQTENNELKSGLTSAAGKIQYLENQITKAKTKIGDVEWKQLQNYIVLYNLPENLDRTELESAIFALTEQLRITHADIHTPSNPSGPIQISNAFRIGKRLEGNQDNLSLLL